MLHLAAGLKALEEAQQNATEEGDVRRTARTTLHLADWYLLTGKTTVAQQLYSQVYTMRDQLDGYTLRGSTLLPAFGIDEQQSEQYSSKNVHIAKARFDIDAEGRPYNIDIIEMNYPLSTSVDLRAREVLKQARFRPALSPEYPSTNEEVELHFSIKESSDSSSQKASTIALRIIISFLKN